MSHHGNHHHIPPHGVGHHGGHGHGVGHHGGPGHGGRGGHCHGGGQWRSQDLTLGGAKFITNIHVSS